MIKFFCDRCRKEVKVKAHLHDVAYEGEHSNKKTIDLCIGCIIALERWVAHGVPEQAKVMDGG